MRLAYFSGCKIPFYEQDYDLSFRAVMGRLGVELIELPFNCCGNPARDENFEVSMLSAIKNLALAQKNGLNVITPCKCCFGQFKHAMHWYDTDEDLKKRIDHRLVDEGLTWDKKIKVSHLLSFIVDDLGIDAFQKYLQKPLPAKKVVLQYGCHALRPFTITGFDNPYEPTIFEKVLQSTGVHIREWSKKTECCGHPIADKQETLSLKILDGKMDAAEAAGADFICTACTHCQMQYEITESNADKNGHHIKAVLVTQIIGAAMGIDEKELSQTGQLPPGMI